MGRIVAGIAARPVFTPAEDCPYPVPERTGNQVENGVYHVLLEGRRIGPYDRRTIIGMRVKKALTSEHVLVGADGMQLTVAELVRQGQQADSSFGPSEMSRLSSSYSVVQGIHAARLLEVEGKGHTIPPFKGELEVRVQTKVLRVSGRYREGLAWKEDRVKFPLQDIAHARLRGTVVDMWMRVPDRAGMQRVRLDLLTHEAAGDLAESLPFAAPWPGSEPLAGRPQTGASAVHPMLWALLVTAAIAVGGVLVWMLAHRA
jgi:hypothetical protein